MSQSAPAPPQCSGNFDDPMQCQFCSQPRFFKGIRGLNVHIGKMHNSAHRSAATPGPSSSLPSQDANTLNPTPPSSPDRPFWERLGSLKNSTPIIKRIPRGARISVANSLSSLIQKVVQNNVEENWEHLLTFAHHSLHIHKNTNDNRSLTQRIKQNCSNLQQGWVIPARHNPAATDLSHQTHSTKNIFRKVEEKLGDGDLKGASNLLFSSDVAAPDSADTLHALQDKHPTPDPSLHLPDAPDPSAAQVTATGEMVLSAVMSFKSGSAGGLDGLSPQHLKDLLCGATGDTGRALLLDITNLINLMLAGKVNAQVLDVLYGANLCALKKKDGGIRPIAIGCTFRRIASKICCRHTLPALQPYFQPRQLGFGSRGGCEAAVHAARTFLDNDGGEVFLKLLRLK